MARRIVSHCALFIFCILVGCAAQKKSYPQFTGVLNSPMQLPCAVDDTIVIETVNWYTNHSNVETLRVSYFPSEQYYAADHEGYEIYDEKNLRIASLDRTDSGIFRCKVLSSASYEYTFVTQLNVLDGCELPNFTIPLTTDCSVGGVLAYQAWCNFTCSPNFHLVGNGSVQCNSNGKLSNEPPHCKALGQCSIPVLGQHLLSSEQCESGSTILPESECTFHCLPGYNLEGNVTLRCQTNGHFDATFPYCEEMDDGGPQIHLGILLGITIPLLVVIVILVSRIYINFKGGHQPRYRTQEKLLQTSIQDWIDGSIELFLEQIPAKGLDRASVSVILKSLNDAENELISSIPILDESVFKCINSYVEQMDKESLVDTKKALATYCFILISYTGDLAKKEQLGSSIIAISGDERNSSNNSYTTLQDKFPEDTTIKLLQPRLFNGETIKGNEENFEKYFTTTHKVFAHLLASIRVNITDENDRRRRTAKVCREMAIKTRTKSDGHWEDGSSGTGMSFQSSGSQNRGSHRFAELCVNKIDICPSVNEKIKLRQYILEQFCV